MKKVDEGVELFDDIWEKVYSAEQQNQKEKYEMDLKKEIKKLQRLRDQIKTWIGSSEVKDKEPLLEARRLIETKMEQFKICEKETKTKTYSKEGLAREERLDPHEQAKADTTSWIGDVVESLQTLVDEAEIEIEKLSAGKGKKTNKHAIDDFNKYIMQHKHHISKLEGIMRLVNNDVLNVDDVDPIKEDLEYYMDSYDDQDYQQAYDEDFFYEALGLDELDVVNVDRVTQAALPDTKKKQDPEDASQSTKGSKGDKKSKKSGIGNIIPLTIGRARASSGSSKKGKNEVEEMEKTPKKREPTPTTIPAARPAPPAPAAGASMAAILKRETEQQEKERQKVGRRKWYCRNGLWSIHVSHFILFSCPGTAGRATATTTGPSGSAAATTTPTPATGSTATSAARGPSTTTAAATTTPTARSCCQTTGTATTRSVAAAATTGSAAGGTQTATSPSPTTTGSSGSASRWRQVIVAIPN